MPATYGGERCSGKWTPRDASERVATGLRSLNGASANLADDDEANAGADSGATLGDAPDEACICGDDAGDELTDVATE